MAPRTREHSFQALSGGETYDLVIAGGGPAGLSAALYGARCGMRVLLLEKGVIGGHAAVLSRIDDYPGMPAADGWQLTRTMEKQARDAGAELIEDQEVVSAAAVNGAVQISTRSGMKFYSRACVIATGGEPEALDVPGARELDRRGVHTCAQCAGPAYRGKEVAVYGNTSQALVAAGHLLGIAEKVFLIIEEKEVEGDRALLMPLLDSPGFELVTGMRVGEIIGRSQMTAVLLRETGGKGTRKVHLDALFVYRRFVPRTTLVSAERDGHGFLKIDSLQQTSFSRIFAAGYVCDPGSRILTALADGARAADSAWRVVRGERMGEVRCETGEACQL